MFFFLLLDSDMFLNIYILINCLETLQENLKIYTLLDI